MMKYLTLLTAFTLIAFPKISFADGNKLLQDCTEMINLVEKNIIPNSEIGAGRCAGFLQGISDMNALYEAYGQPTFFCMPKGVNNGQKIKVIIKYLNDHPEKLHEIEAGVALMAFTESFPCKK